MAFDIFKWGDAANQEKYYSDVKLAYKRQRDLKQTMKYFITASTKNASHATFYSADTLEATEFLPLWDKTPAVGITGTPKPGGGIIPATRGIAPVNQKDIFTAHRMPFKMDEIPKWIQQYDLLDSQVDLSGTIVKEQVQGIIRREEVHLLTMFKNVFNGTLQCERANNTSTFSTVTVGIPTANKLGDIAKPVDTVDNWGAFREASVMADSLTGGRFMIITGQKGWARILNTTKTESRDFNPYGNSVVTGKIAPMLFGGEVVTFPQFDTVFDVQNQGVIPFFIVCADAVAYDKPTKMGMDASYHLVKEKHSFFFQIINRYNSTVIDETGIFSVAVQF